MFWLLSLGPAVSYGQAQAGDNTADNAQLGRAQVELAERAYAEGKYREAIGAFLAADRLQPDPALQLSVARSYEKLNDASRALASYREYFKRAPRSSDRAQVQLRVVALAKQLYRERGLQQVSISSSPTGATVLIDEQPVGITPIYVDLTPGAHRVEFRQRGYESALLEFELPALQPLNVMTTLVPPPQAAHAPTPPSADASSADELAPADVAGLAGAGALGDEPVADELATLMRTSGFAAIGSSVAALGAAVTFELTRSHSESRAAQQRQQVEFARMLDSMHSQQTWARVFAVTAGLLAASGGVLLVLAAEREARPGQPSLGFACLPSVCQAGYRGSF